MNQAFSDTGIIIKIIDFGEADRLISVITNEHGLIDLVAKGARRITSRKASHLDILNLIKLQVVRSNRPQILVQAELVEPHLYLKNNLKMVRTSYYLTEILNSILAPEQPDKDLFCSLKNYLTHLNQPWPKTSTRQMSIDFQFYLLRHLGFPEPKGLSPDKIIDHFENIINKKINSRNSFR